jgi:hypothetical protein
MGRCHLSDSTEPEIMKFSDYGDLYVFRIALDWELFHSYKRQITPEESQFKMLSHTWEAMIEWCEKQCRGRWWTDHILGVGFCDEGDAIRFKLTFCKRNNILDHMFTARKHTYSGH